MVSKSLGKKYTVYLKKSYVVLVIFIIALTKYLIKATSWGKGIIAAPHFRASQFTIEVKTHNRDLSQLMDGTASSVRSRGVMRTFLRPIFSF